MTSNRFLAFVEDVSATNSVVGESNEANEVIELYRENCGKDPTHLVWLDGIEEFYSKPPTLRHHACHYCKYAIQNELIDDVLTDTIHNDFA